MKRMLALLLAGLTVLSAPGPGLHAAAPSASRAGVLSPGLPALASARIGVLQAAPVPSLAAGIAPPAPSLTAPAATAVAAVPVPVALEAGRAFDPGDGGRKAILLVGTSASRPFILAEAKRVADELGMNLYLLDRPGSREASRDAIPDERFISAAIDDHEPATSDAIVDRVAGLAGSREIGAVVTFLNPYALLAGEIVDRIGAKGLSGKGIAVAHTKSSAREAMASIPEIATPHRVVRSGEEARRFFREQGGGKIVMKPIKGGGSQGVITDIASEEEAVASFTRLDADLIEFTKRPDAGFFNLDRHPGIMVERQLYGPEVDVELIVQDGEVKFSHVSDNAPMDRPHAVEKNTTYASVLPENVQRPLVDGAAKAAAAMGLRDGNLHVEMMMTPDGPRVLEVNARMGGAFVWEFIKDQTGISLVEQGIRAVLGLPVDSGRRPDTTLEARFLIPAASGRLESIEGLDAAERLPGFVRSTMLHKVGDAVRSAAEDAFDYLGYVGVRGKTYDQAMDRMMAILNAVKIRIRRADGSLVEQTGAHSHGKVDMNSLLAPEQRPKP